MFKKIIVFFISFCFAFEQVGFAQIAGQLDISARMSSMIGSIAFERYRPLHLRYLSYDQLNNDFKLLLDKGTTKETNPEVLEKTTGELLKYFFIGIALPNDTFWVNLRPDSPNEIINDGLAKTDMGKVMLECDLQLKKDTAKYTSPETLEGRAYWDKLYKKAEELYGSENITIPTLTRPWIVPDEIIVREAKGSAYIYKATLKVMLEQDYLKGNSTYNFTNEKAKLLNEYSSQIIRESIIPKLTREVNSSKRYAPLRQVYYSLILAQWFKQSQKGTFSQVTSKIDKKDLTNLASKTNWDKDTYFKAYQKSFKDGEYNIQESRQGAYGQTIRTYFSGGEQFASIEPLIAAGKMTVSNENLGSMGGVSYLVSSEGDGQGNIIIKDNVSSGGSVNEADKGLIDGGKRVSTKLLDARQKDDVLKELLIKLKETKAEENFEQVVSKTLNPADGSRGFKTEAQFNDLQNFIKEKEDFKFKFGLSWALTGPWGLAIAVFANAASIPLLPLGAAIYGLVSLIGGYKIMVDSVKLEYLRGTIEKVKKGEALPATKNGDTELSDGGTIAEQIEQTKQALAEKKAIIFGLGMDSRMKKFIEWSPAWFPKLEYQTGEPRSAVEIAKIKYEIAELEKKLIQLNNERLKAYELEAARAVVNQGSIFVVDTNLKNSPGGNIEASIVQKAEEAKFKAVKNELGPDASPELIGRVSKAITLKLVDILYNSDTPDQVTYVFQPSVSDGGIEQKQKTAFSTKLLFISTIFSEFGKARAIGRLDWEMLHGIESTYASGFYRLSNELVDAQSSLNKSVINKVGKERVVEFDNFLQTSAELSGRLAVLSGIGMVGVPVIVAIAGAFSVPFAVAFFGVSVPLTAALAIQSISANVIKEYGGIRGNEKSVELYGERKATADRIAEAIVNAEQLTVSDGQNEYTVKFRTSTYADGQGLKFSRQHIAEEILKGLEQGKLHGDIVKVNGQPLDKPYTADIQYGRSVQDDMNGYGGKDKFKNIKGQLYIFMHEAGAYSFDKYESDYKLLLGTVALPTFVAADPLIAAKNELSKNAHNSWRAGVIEGQKEAGLDKLGNLVSPRGRSSENADWDKQKIAAIQSKNYEDVTARLGEAQKKLLKEGMRLLNMRDGSYVIDMGDGTIQLDTLNTPYDSLSPAWKAKNSAAVDAAAGYYQEGLALGFDAVQLQTALAEAIQRGTGENGQKLNEEYIAGDALKKFIVEIGNKEHIRWMNANDWQKKDKPELFVAFEALPASEQVKDLKGFKQMVDYMAKDGGDIEKQLDEIKNKVFLDLPNIKGYDYPAAPMRRWAEEQYGKAKTVDDKIAIVWNAIDGLQTDLSESKPNERYPEAYSTAQDNYKNLKTELGKLLRDLIEGRHGKAVSVTKITAEQLKAAQDIVKENPVVTSEVGTETAERRLDGFSFVGPQSYRTVYWPKSESAIERDARDEARKKLVIIIAKKYGLKDAEQILGLVSFTVRQWTWMSNPKDTANPYRRIEFSTSVKTLDGGEDKAITLDNVRNLDLSYEEEFALDDAVFSLFVKRQKNISEVKISDLNEVIGLWQESTRYRSSVDEEVKKLDRQIVSLFSIIEKIKGDRKAGGGGSEVSVAERIADAAVNAEQLVVKDDANNEYTIQFRTSTYTDEQGNLMHSRDYIVRDVGNGLGANKLHGDIVKVNGQPLDKPYHADIQYGRSVQDDMTGYGGKDKFENIKGQLYGFNKAPGSADSIDKYESDYKLLLGTVALPAFVAADPLIAAKNELSKNAHNSWRAGVIEGQKEAGLDKLGNLVSPRGRSSENADWDKQKIAAIQSKNYEDVTARLGEAQKKLLKEGMRLLNMRDGSYVIDMGDGTIQLDTLNTPYDSLSPAWKAKNSAAVDAAAGYYQEGLALGFDAVQLQTALAEAIQRGTGENGQKLNEEYIAGDALKKFIVEIGNKEHIRWMNANDWQKKDKPELFVAFEALPASEQVKDLKGFKQMVDYMAKDGGDLTKEVNDFSVFLKDFAKDQNAVNQMKFLTIGQTDLVQLIAGLVMMGATKPVKKLSQELRSKVFQAVREIEKDKQVRDYVYAISKGENSGVSNLLNYLADYLATGNKAPITVTAPQTEVVIKTTNPDQLREVTAERIADAAVNAEQLVVKDDANNEYTIQFRTSTYTDEQGNLMHSRDYIVRDVGNGLGANKLHGDIVKVNGQPLDKPYHADIQYGRSVQDDMTGYGGKDKFENIKGQLYGFNKAPGSADSIDKYESDYKLLLGTVALPAFVAADPLIAAKNELSKNAHNSWRAGVIEGQKEAGLDKLGNLVSPRGRSSENADWDKQKIAAIQSKNYEDVTARLGEAQKKLLKEGMRLLNMRDGSYVIDMGDGTIQLDTLNTPYDSLSPAWKAKNSAAVDAAAGYYQEGLALGFDAVQLQTALAEAIQRGTGENGQKLNEEYIAGDALKKFIVGIGNKEHIRWMNANDWQKKDKPELFVAFEALPASEQVKDLKGFKQMVDYMAKDGGTKTNLQNMNDQDKQRLIGWLVKTDMDVGVEAKPITIVTQEGRRWTGYLTIETVHDDSGFTHPEGYNTHVYGPGFNDLKNDIEKGQLRLWTKIGDQDKQVTFYWNSPEQLSPDYVVVPRVAQSFWGSFGKPFKYQEVMMNRPGDKYNLMPTYRVVDVVAIEGLPVASGRAPVTAPQTEVNPQGRLGGIDFRSLPIITQPMGEVLMKEIINMPAVNIADLDQEWQSMQKMIQADACPSTQRIKEFLGACYQKGELKQRADKVLACLAGMLRMEEDECKTTEPQVKVMLALLEYNR